jgi:general nucleoside transport system permease protein
MPTLDIVMDASFWATTIALSAPFAFGVLGAIVCARAGVIHLGIDGIFIAGAFAGALASQLGGGAWDGVMAAAAVGGLFGLLIGALIGPCGAAQPLAGIAVTLLAASLAHGAMRLFVAGAPDAARSVPFSPVEPPLPAEWPTAVATILQQTPLVYIAILLALAVSYVLGRTPLGLALKACGDNPAAVEAQGRSVHGLRFGAAIAGSVMMAIGGAGLTLATAASFRLDLGGRGFVCLALAAAAGWRPMLAIAAVLPLGAIEAARVHLAPSLAESGTADVLAFLPHAFALVALIAAGTRTRGLSALGSSFVRARDSARPF